MKKRGQNWVFKVQSCNIKDERLNRTSRATQYNLELKNIPLKTNSRLNIEEKSQSTESIAI